MVYKIGGFMSWRARHCTEKYQKRKQRTTNIASVKSIKHPLQSYSRGFPEAGMVVDLSVRGITVEVSPTRTI